jgi:hypothetical protein
MYSRGVVVLPALPQTTLWKQALCHLRFGAALHHGVKNLCGGII